MNSDSDQSNVRNWSSEEILEMSVNTALDCLNISGDDNEELVENCAQTNTSIDIQMNATNSSLNGDYHHIIDEKQSAVNGCQQQADNCSTNGEECDDDTQPLNFKSNSNSDKCEDNCEKSSVNNENMVLGSDQTTDKKPVDTNASNISYPLRYRWQLWFWRADHGVKVIWTDALQKVCSFDTIEGFWRLYHHIKGVRHLSPPSDYCVFKEGIKPMWEDVGNRKGGRWILEFPKAPNRECCLHLDEIWLEVLLCLIGEGFNDFGEEICGAVVNIRAKEDRISVWTANADKSVANLRIGEILKMRTGYKGIIKYEAHETSQKIALLKERDTNSPHKRLMQHVKPNRRSCIF